ncbi:MAG: PEP-CTERM sorting domain-containing protein [Acidobacteriota bacterium]|nr:PEP-CTERM sorting domain-containing protein [Acidobacteriota bacterium]
MKKAILGIGLALAIALVPASAATITGLFNTGVDNNGVPLADGTVDTHYILLSQPSGSGPVNPFVVSGSPSTFPFPPWMANSSVSKWVGPQADQSNVNNEPLPGNYTYRLYFVVTGADFASVVLNGRFSSDNIGHIFCASGCTVTPNTGNPNVGTDDMSSTIFTSFSISGLTQGTNALDFIVNNAGSTNTATGLRVEISSVPEPATMMMGAIGLLAVGLLRRRRRS